MNTRLLSLVGAGCFALSVASALAEDWAQWRGPNRDGVSKETGLMAKWTEGGPKLTWKAEHLGSGYSTPSVAKGQVFVVGSPDGKTEELVAVSESGGKQLWSTK